MYEDSEDISDVDEDFFNALALLRSTEDDSAEKLRKMLDTSIEKRYGFDKTLLARMPKRFLQNTKVRGKSFANERTDAPLNRRGCTAKETGNPPSQANNAVESNWKTMETFNMDAEDDMERGDIPTISIPDEGSGDGLLCKICSGAKLGPLILLECQECQEVYHPLCHQPPVVDIDVYDPRIVWRCKKCTDTSPINPDIAFDEREAKRSRPAKDPGKIKEASTKVDKLGKLNGSLLKNETNIPGEISPDAQKAGSVAEDSLIAKGSFRLARKITKIPSSNQLRKRIGSKLSVTRPVVK